MRGKPQPERTWEPDDILAGLGVALLLLAAPLWAFSPADPDWALGLAMLSGLALAAARFLARRRGGKDSHAIAQDRQLLSTAFSTAANGIVVTDVEGVVLWVNPAFLELTGYPEAEVVGKNLRLLKSGEQSSEVYKELWATILAGRVWSGEIVNRRRDGRTYVEEQTITPVRSGDGAITHFVAIKHDITARKQAERELRESKARVDSEVEARTAQLAAANRDLEMFAYAVSHDLRAPLRAIDFFGRELSECANRVLDDEARGYLERIMVARRRMVLLVDGMMALFHLGKGELRGANVDLTRLASEALDELRKAHPGRAVDFSVQSGMHAWGDQRLIMAALGNLLGNAWKFTGKRARARIEVGMVTMEGVPTFFVRDNGAGFDMAYADRLFTAIRRLHTQEEFEGNGIGLVSVHRVILRHHGRIWVEAAEGKGATFFFTLGSAAAGAAAAAVPAISPSGN